MKKILDTIKYFFKYIILIYSIQFMILILFEIFIINHNKTNKIYNKTGNDDVIKMILINYKILNKIFYNNHNNIDKLICKYKYYYYLINDEHVVCSFFNINNENYFYINGLLKKDMNVLNLFTSLSQKYYKLNYLLYKYNDGKHIKIIDKIDIYSAFTKVYQYENVKKINILSVCFGTYLLSKFIHKLNKFDIKLYIYESSYYSDTIMNAKNINVIYINNNNSFFDIYHNFLHDKIKNYSVINVNKFNIKTFVSICPIYNVFLYRHIFNVYLHYKSQI